MRALLVLVGLLPLLAQQPVHTRSRACCCRACCNSGARPSALAGSDRPGRPMGPRTYPAASTHTAAS